MNVDNAAEEYYDFTPYSYVANSPLIAVDPTGERIIIVGTKEYRSKVLYQMFLAARSKEGFDQLVAAIESKNTLVIQLGDSEEQGSYIGGVYLNADSDEADDTYTRFLNYNPSGTEEADGVIMTPDEILVHETDHFNNDNNSNPYYTGKSYNDGNGVLYESFPSSEVGAVGAQNRHRDALNKDPRRTYTGDMGTSVDVYNKKYDNKTGKLVPAVNSKGKSNPPSTILIYLSGTKMEVHPPSAKKLNVNYNKTTSKGVPLNKMEIYTIEKSKNKN